MLNLVSHEGLENSFPQHGFEKSLCDHYITIIFQQQVNLEALIQTRLKGYYNKVRISLDQYGSKIRKVSRGRPTVLNETILATKHNWHCTIGFLINTAPLNAYFILHYDLFFRK